MVVGQVGWGGVGNWADWQRTFLLELQEEIASSRCHVVLCAVFKAVYEAQTSLKLLTRD